MTNRPQQPDHGRRHSGSLPGLFKGDGTLHRKQTSSAVVRPRNPETGVEEREVLLRSTHEEEIRNRAYQIYLQRGGQLGYELEDWLQAERELTK